MAYGIDVPTEVGYIYSKKIPSEDAQNAGTKSEPEGGLPTLKTIIWEEPRGRFSEEKVDAKASLTDVFIRKKAKHEMLDGAVEYFNHSGDGSVPYLSLAWAHTWLLHAARAKRFSEDDLQQDNRNNALHHIEISHRPQGAAEWVEGPPPTEPIEVVDDRKMVDEADTGTSHPHGTRYKPEMVRYHNLGISRTTGIEYTTTLFEAIGVEHKETTR
jgi:hypothetical protein